MDALGASVADCVARVSWGLECLEQYAWAAECPWPSVAERMLACVEHVRDTWDVRTPEEATRLMRVLGMPAQPDVVLEAALVLLDRSEEEDCFARVDEAHLEDVLYFLASAAHRERMARGALRVLHRLLLGARRHAELLGATEDGVRLLLDMCHHADADVVASACAVLELALRLDEGACRARFRAADGGRLLLATHARRCTDALLAIGHAVLGHARYAESVCSRRVLLGLMHALSEDALVAAAATTLGNALRASPQCARAVAEVGGAARLLVILSQTWRDEEAREAAAFALFHASTECHDAIVPFFVGRRASAVRILAPLLARPSRVRALVVGVLANLMPLWTDRHLVLTRLVPLLSVPEEEEEGTREETLRALTGVLALADGATMLCRAGGVDPLVKLLPETPLGALVVLERALEAPEAATAFFEAGGVGVLAATMRGSSRRATAVVAVRVLSLATETHEAACLAALETGAARSALAVDSNAVLPLVVHLLLHTDGRGARELEADLPRLQRRAEEGGSEDLVLVRPSYATWAREALARLLDARLGTSTLEELAAHTDALRLVVALGRRLGLSMRPWGEDATLNALRCHTAYLAEGLAPPSLEDFACPLTHAVVLDPAVASDGHTYERAAIRTVLDGAAVSPLTREPLTDALYPNHFFQRALWAVDGQAWQCGVCAAWNLERTEACVHWHPTTPCEDE